MIHQLSITYDYNGRQYEVRAVTERFGSRLRLYVGQDVELAVDPAKPGRAYLVAQFVS